VSVCSPSEDEKSAEPAMKQLRGGCPPPASIPATSLSELVTDTDAGVDVISQVLGGTWWEWVNGSGLFFWRWPEGQQMKAARDGINIFVWCTLPTNKRAMQSPPTKKLEKIARKVGKVRKSKYIKAGMVSNLTDFFDVPKGEDIRIVYNGTRSGLNDALWAPSFFLPTTNTAARVMSFYTYCVDLDLGEMFLNFLMDKKIQAFAGVDVTCLQVFFNDYVPAEHKPQMWERWERLFMEM
jgi:hypothetical protein